MMINLLLFSVVFELVRSLTLSKSWIKNMKRFKRSDAYHAVYRCVYMWRK